MPPAAASSAPAPANGKADQKEKENALVRLLAYFPARLMIGSFLVSIIIVGSNEAIQTAHEQILAGMLSFFQFPSFYLDGNLYIGSFHDPAHFLPPTIAESVFLIFLFALALTAPVHMRMRLKILAFPIALSGILVVGHFLVIIITSAAGLASETAFLRASVVFAAIAGGGMIEACLFSVMTLPKPNKIPVPVVKRSYLREYTYLSLMLVAAVGLVYFLLAALDIREDSVVTAYAALSIPTIMSFKYYFAYIPFEVRNPKWAEICRRTGDTYRPLVSFLMPAYNEEKTIVELIESIDRAASKYTGKVEIVLVNDGSTDNTAKLAEEALSNMRYSKYKLFNLPNMGKGHALKVGLENCEGEIIFRVDADSIMHEDAITPIVRHFNDPKVGTVAGMIMPLEQKTITQGIGVLLACRYLYYRRGMELIDSVLVQPGTFSVFRKDALLKVGSWESEQFGEDGEITMRMGRHGYKIEFEQDSLSLSRWPGTWRGIRLQRVRWSIAFYHSRARNLNMIKEFAGPRTVIYLDNLLTHGSGFPRSIFWAFMLATLTVGATEFSPNMFLGLVLTIPTKLAAIELFTSGMEMLLFVYFLKKFNKMNFMRYIPFISVFNLYLSTLVKPEALGILLAFSSKYSELNKKSHQVLRKMILKKTSWQSKQPAR